MHFTRLPGEHAKEVVTAVVSRPENDLRGHGANDDKYSDCGVLNLYAALTLNSAGKTPIQGLRNPQKSVSFSQRIPADRLWWAKLKC
jgi:hypothetical protein